MADRTWGLHSLGKFGTVELDLDESNDDGPKAYMLTLSFPSVEVRFEMASTGVVDALSRFVSEHYGRKDHAEFTIGHFHGCPILLVKDDRHPDRFFLRVVGDALIEITIVDPVTSDFVHAVCELATQATATLQ